MVTNDTCDPFSAGVVQVLDVSYGFLLASHLILFLWIYKQCFLLPKMAIKIRFNLLYNEESVP
jgi:hypothetical protein